jgi:hypothetical protein
LSAESAELRAGNLAKLGFVALTIALSISVLAADETAAIRFRT